MLPIVSFHIAGDSFTKSEGRLVLEDIDLIYSCDLEPTTKGVDLVIKLRVLGIGKSPKIFTL